MTGARIGSGLTTHVLDTARGVPAAGVGVVLDRLVPDHHGDGHGERLAAAETDGDGRAVLVGTPLAPGDYRLTFATGAWFAAAGTACFHPEIAVAFRVDEVDEVDAVGDMGAGAHHHVPLLLSPYGYSTYRGS